MQLIQRDTLRQLRREYLIGWQQYNSDALQKIEREFGSLLYTPLDVEPILPNDSAAFKDWFLANSTPVKKLKPDVAGGVSDKYMFLAVSSPNLKDLIWTVNPIDAMAVFPEIAEKLKQLPLSMLPPWAMWSSMARVSPHRDQGSWEDFPSSLRIMLYDENPSETLYLQENVSGIGSVSPPHLLRYRPTNVFAWNNVRTVHGSFHTGRLKILLILHLSRFRLQEYGDLLRRSEAKFQGEAWRGKHDAASFY